MTKPKAAKERRQRIARSIAGAFRHRHESRKDRAEEAARGGGFGQNEKPPADTGSNDELAIFGDDVLLLIISFVSYAPYETEEIQWRKPQELGDGTGVAISADHLNLYAAYLRGKDTGDRTRLLRPKQNKKNNRGKGSLQIHSFGTLTHVLPMVCKRFHELCSGSTSDILWLQAIQRLAANDVVGWCWPLWKLSHEGVGSDGEDTILPPDAFSRKKISEMVAAAFSFHHDVYKCGARSFFQHLTTAAAEPRVFSGHLLHNKNLHPPKLGASYRLTISSREALSSIRWLMQHRPSEDLSGSKINDDEGLRRRPRALYNYGVDDANEGDPVLLVEITRCLVERNDRDPYYEIGCYNLTVVPIMHVRLSKGLSSSVHAAFPRMTDAAARTLEVARLLRPIQKCCETDEARIKNTVSAPMIRMFSTVAPQLGMEFLIEGIDIALHSSLLDRMLIGRPRSHSDGEVIFVPHSADFPRPTIIYTCQPDRWMPLGDGIPGEDAFVIEIRRIKINGASGTFTVTGVPIQLGKLLGPTETNGTPDLSCVLVKINVVLGPFGPKLI